MVFSLLLLLHDAKLNGRFKSSGGRRIIFRDSHLSSCSLCHRVLWGPKLYTASKSNQTSSWKKISLAAEIHECMLLAWEVLKLLIAWSAFWQSITVCLACSYSLTSTSFTGPCPKKDTELEDIALWPSTAILTFFSLGGKCLFDSMAPLRHKW